MIPDSAHLDMIAAHLEQAISDVRDAQDELDDLEGSGSQLKQVRKRLNAAKARQAHWQVEWQVWQSKLRLAELALSPIGEMVDTNVEDTPWATDS